MHRIDVSLLRLVGLGVPGCKAVVDISTQLRTSPKVAQLIVSCK